LKISEAKTTLVMGTGYAIAKPAPVGAILSHR